MANTSFWDEKTFVALDIETTGLNPETAEIIELGAVLFCNGIELDTFSCFVKPLYKVPLFIKQLTGITDENLEDGLPVNFALEKLDSFIGSHTLICHNSSFDIGFIQFYKSIHNLPYLTNPVIDTLELSKIYLPFLNNHKLGTISKAFEQEPLVKDKPTPPSDIEKEIPKRLHRALYDAFSTGNVLLHITNFAVKYIPFNINCLVKDLVMFSEIDSFLGNHLDTIVSYQRKYSLVNDLKVNRLWDTTLVDKLGISRSHSFVNTKIGKDNNDNEYNNILNSEALNDKSDNPADKTFNDDTQNSEEECYRCDENDNAFIHSSFNPQGFINKYFPDYKYRDGQVKMATHIKQTLTDKNYLLVEAGTGIGKSFAYLVPAIELAHKKQQKTFISTNTKNLQEQLFFKDLPILKKSLPLHFKAVLLKGRDNYLCLRKWNDLVSSYKNNLSQRELFPFIYLAVWQYYTKTGDVSENSSFKKVPGQKTSNKYSTLWKKLAADRFLCSGKHCSHYLKCYYQSIRQKVEDADLVIINHHLLLTDLCNNRFNSEDCSLIIDEAHNLPELASQYLGISLAYYDFNNLFSHIFNTNRNIQTGMLASLKADIQKSSTLQENQVVLISDINNIIENIETNQIIIPTFFRSIGQMVKLEGSYGKMRIHENHHQSILTLLSELETFCIDVCKKFINLSHFLTKFESNQIANYDDHSDKIKGISQSLNELIDALNTLKKPDWENYAYWINSINSIDTDYPNGIINYSPLDISEQLQSILYQKIDAIVFTSATLSLRNNFKYFSSRMGIDIIPNKNIEELIVQSPFDYDNQTCVLVPKFLPPHTDKYFQKQSIELLKKIIGRSKKGSMILFTSYKDLNFVHDNLSKYLYEKGKMLLTQGKYQSRSVILNEFKIDGKAVLLGTNSFWEGVDIPGDSLSLLILYKLPFQVPSEPIIEAYYDKLKRENKDPFMYATLPNAMLKLRQGFGRLIRNHNDKGIVLILDSRIIHKKYGAYFKEIIPTSVRNIDTLIQLEDIIYRWYRK